MAIQDRGFASMERSKQREIASRGGKAAHEKGTAHEWTKQEASEAGRKGGMASRRKSAQSNQGAAPANQAPVNGSQDLDDESAVTENAENSFQATTRGEHT
jgi:general stress protein YciG